MKLDTKALRYLTPEDWRVLAGVEQGSKNHEVVPTTLITQLANLRGGSGVHKSISTLAKSNLIARTKNAKYDGYRLTYGGYDYLSLHTHLKRSTLYSVGNCIGTGKESDIYVCASPAGTQHVLKIHRLGRISFRSVKNNRDYLRHRNNASWMYMSRLAALKEFSFMQALAENGFAVPEPIAWSRHTVVMGLVDGVPLRAVREVADPAGLYAQLMEIVMRMAQFGLIHGDFNEFNIMILEEEERLPPPPKKISDVEDPEEEEDKGETKEEPEQISRICVRPVVIDFPQMVSVDHANAEMYFDRDVNCVKRFFKRKFHFTSSEPGPFFAAAKKAAGASGGKRLDVEVEASGFSKKMAKELEKYMQAVGADGDGNDTESEGSVVDESDDELDGHGEDVEDCSEKGPLIAEKDVQDGSTIALESSPQGVNGLSIGSGQ